MIMKENSSPFGLGNLPYGVITTAANQKKRCAIAYGEDAIDLSILQQLGVFSQVGDLEDDIFRRDSWNEFATLGRKVHASFRQILRSCIVEGAHKSALIALADVQCHLPMKTRNFSDFYCSLEHTQNCSDVFGTNITPNWYAVPSVYNGRTSSLAVSGTDVCRPFGMYPDATDSNEVLFHPELHMDFEVEIGVWVSKPIPRGRRLDINNAVDHIFGLTLLNDWSAREIQKFEMAPLGPFHAKGSATTVSPWIVPFEALEICRCSRYSVQHPAPPPHLTWQDSGKATFNIELKATILRNGRSYTACESNLNELHWTPFQQIAHLSSAGEGLSPGDLFGTGTISSSRTNHLGERIGLGCLFERQLPETRLTSLPTDISETYLLDGDEVVLEGFCKDETGKVIFGFGQCRGRVVPAWQN